MKQRIGRIFGIDVFLHVSALLLFLWVALAGYVETGTMAGAATQSLLLLLVLAIVVLHEAGHALMARRFGIGTRSITLYLFGGMSRLERIPSRPAEEVLVSLAGPSINVGVALILALAGLAWTGSMAWAWQDSGLLASFFWINLGLAVFNLLPAFPMDGGRILRAFLAGRVPHLQATEAAARVGQLLAMGFALVGFLGSVPMLVVVAVVIWWAGEQESRQEGISDLLSHVTVKALADPQFAFVRPEASVLEAAVLLQGTPQAELPVLRDRHLEGLLPRTRVLASLHAAPATPVVDLMRHDVPIVAPDKPVDEALQTMVDAEVGSVPVVVDDQVVGLLTLDGVGRYVQLENARRG